MNVEMYMLGCMIAYLGGLWIMDEIRRYSLYQKRFNSFLPRKFYPRQATKRV